MCFFILYNVEKERGESTGNEERRPTAYYSERGEGIRDEERADGVLLLRRGPLDEVYDALYAF